MHNHLETPFTTVVADPPWRYGNTAARGAAEKHYATLDLQTICGMPVEGLVAENAHLYLWTTNYFLASGDAAKVVRSWGFEPKTILTWEKTGRLGVGNYFRNSTEHMIFATRGKLRTAGVNNVRTCFTSPWIAHSRKPEWSYEIIASKSPGPTLELFARGFPDKPLPQTWSRWGNEVPNAAKIPTLDAYFAALSGV